MSAIVQRLLHSACMTHFAGAMLSHSRTNSAPGVELLFPGLLLLPRFAQERRQRSQADEGAVEPVPGPAQRPGEVDEQHHAPAAGVVPYFVVEAVVEDQRLAFVPGTDLVADADTAAFARLGHLQAQVETQHAVVGAAMRRDVLARREDAEEG